MDIKERNIVCKLPFYYSMQDSENPLPFSPFLVATLEKEQDVFIIAPDIFAKEQSNFIKLLYNQFEQFKLSKPAARFFSVDKAFCIAIILPTDEFDESGRPGVYVSIGFIVNSACTNVQIIRYFNTLIKVIYDNLGISLPLSGANELLYICQQHADKIEMIPKLRDAFLSLINISASIGDFSKSTDIKTLSSDNKKTFPKLSLYSDKSDFKPILDYLLTNLCSQSVSKGIFKNVLAGTDVDAWLLPGLPYSEAFSKAKEVDLKILKEDIPVLLIK